MALRMSSSISTTKMKFWKTDNFLHYFLQNHAKSNHNNFVHFFKIWSNLIIFDDLGPPSMPRVSAPWTRARPSLSTSSGTTRSRRTPPPTLKKNKISSKSHRNRQNLITFFVFGQQIWCFFIFFYLRILGYRQRRWHPVPGQGWRQGLVLSSSALLAQLHNRSTSQIIYPHFKNFNELYLESCPNENVQIAKPISAFQFETVLINILQLVLSLNK